MTCGAGGEGDRDSLPRWVAVAGFAASRRVVCATQTIPWRRASVPGRIAVSRFSQRLSQVFAVLVLSLFATACASLPQEVHRTPSTALSNPVATPLGRLVADSAPNPDLSGFHLVASGQEAYGTIVTLAEKAVRTLDLQYYIVAGDESSREVFRHVRAAAERGVRVRLLVDDLHSDGKDRAFLMFAQHPNIEVRLFNPFPGGRFSKMTRMLSSAADLKRVNRRMHNKVIIADNALAMTGGRNIANAYFLRAPDSNFVDLDVIVAGPATRKLSEAFDRYWNSPFAFPVEALASPASGSAPTNRNQAGSQRSEQAGAEPAKAEPGARNPASGTAAAPEQALVDAEDEQKRFEAQGMTSPARIDATRSYLARQIAGRKLNFEWASATVLVDDPAKVSPEKTTEAADSMVADLARMLDDAKQEVILISPYFVPGERGVTWLGGLAKRGVKVRVLTNSLAATDSPIVHVGYKKYRKPLLEAGVELHELKARLGKQQRAIGDFSSSQASLHVKAAVADRNVLFVGSMNFDPRSITQNTETALIIRSPKLAAEVARLFAGSIDQNSYLLKLSDSGDLLWMDGMGPNAKALDTEPDTTWSQRVWIDLLGPITPEELL